MTTNRSPAGRSGDTTGWRSLLSESRPPTRWDVAVTVATLAAMVTTVVVRTSEPAFPGTQRLVFTVVSWLPLLVRTYWPEPALAAVVAVEVCQLAVMHDLGSDLPGGLSVAAYQPIPLATMLAVHTVATRRRQRDGWLAGAVAAFVLLVAALLFQPLRLAGTDLVMVQVVVIAAGLGVATRARRDARAQRARAAREQARQAVLGERLRIARELHDTLAHELALVDAQAGVADYLLDVDPRAARQALRGITQHTSAAIDDLRATLLLLRGDPDETDALDEGRPGAAGGEVPRTGAAALDARSLAPVAGLDRLDSLLERLRDAGTPVTLDVLGEPVALGHQSDLAAYRIIQEALTNATKHAPGAPVDLTLCWTRSQLRLEIRNTRSVRPGQRHPAGTGHGLIGLRERARAAGGTFDAGPTGDGGYLVTAALPAGARHPTHDPAVPDVDAAAPESNPPDTKEPRP
ncbi:sensor histidine kinase [Frankia sp. CNm7]|uniref:histidine kinase n=1 Tax=Frankia nepalensis TaxID=1836974 RepID=A0A937RL68_9ACTN|nr:histidine kinase [Frankia nepalensis]MBL7498240.1 sensor histidine kinase [Frankia nepalensis]MBL7509536.1 sensor histidine kinase [Frankia nepalensis]MBL7517276.1 sensor histidine kinase [Frankia nepalensis]MBL7632167.1 sensor histidine kinase [Frankia nepalensis]